MPTPLQMRYPCAMQGYLQKMRAELVDETAQYYLRLDDGERALNSLIGHRITLHHTGNIRCQACHEPTNKSFSQGYCYRCFKTLARCDLCVVSPERCHFAEGTCREPDWGESFCMQPHLVYLANSSGIKVGITREQNLPTRWIDQGAVQATPIARVDTRQQAGFVEVAFKQHISDKTNWQQMLKAENRHIDLQAARDELLACVDDELEQLRARFGRRFLRIEENGIQTIRYPVDRYPTKVVALRFDKTPTVEGVLTGIKGQYLLLDTGVINLRRFTSYEIAFSAGEREAEAGSGQTLSLF